MKSVPRIAQRAISNRVVFWFRVHWAAHSRSQRKNQFCKTDELVHDQSHIGVNGTEVHTDSLTVRTKSLVLKTRPNLPKWGRNSGRGVKLVDFENMGSWCEPVAVPCEQPSRERSPTPQIEQHSQVALAGSIPMKEAKNVDFGYLGSWCAPSISV